MDKINGSNEQLMDKRNSIQGKSISHMQLVKGLTVDIFAPVASYRSH